MQVLPRREKEEAVQESGRSLGNKRLGSTASLGRGLRENAGPLVLQTASSRAAALDLLEAVIHKFKRVGVTGRPGVGKSHLASTLQAELGFPLIHTDCWKHHSWDRQKELAYYEYTLQASADPITLVMEGVTVARVARMQPPCFRALVWLRGPDRAAKRDGTSYKREALGHCVEKWVREVELPIYCIQLKY